MEKTLLTVALTTILTACAFAAAQYTNILSNQGVGIIMTDNASVTLSFMRSNGSAADYSSAFPSGYNMFGYYTMDSKGNMLTKGKVDLSKLTDGKVTIGDFKTGDQIVFWAADAKGDYMESMHRDKEKGTTRDSAYVDNNGTETIVTMGVINEQGWGPERSISSINDKSNYIFAITTGSGNSQAMGQPLPSIAMTLLLAGVAIIGVAMLRRRMKRQKE